MSFLASMADIINAAIVLIVSFALVRVISYVVNKIGKFNIDMTLVYLTRDIIQYIIAFIAILLVLDIFGINLTSIFISLGIAGIAVGFAAKDIISNFMSGIILLADKNIRVGDVIEVSGYKGVIKKISFRHTIIENEDLEPITIPNQTLSNNPYIKFKRVERNKIAVPVTIPSEIDVNDFEDKILAFINSMDVIAKEPKAYLQSEGIGDYGTKVIVKCYLKKFKDKKLHTLTITKEARKIIEEMKK